MSKLEKVEWIAQRMNVPTYRAYELARTGVLPSVRIGRQLRFDPTAIEKFIAEGGTAKVGGTDEAA